MDAQGLLTSSTCRCFHSQTPFVSLHAMVDNELCVSKMQKEVRRIITLHSRHLTAFLAFWLAFINRLAILVSLTPEMHPHW